MTGIEQIAQQKIATARAYRDSGDYQRALALYQDVAQHPVYAPYAFLEASDILMALGQGRAALQAVRLALGANPQMAEARQRLARLLRHLVIEKYNQGLDQDFQHCFAEPDVDHQQLAGLVASLICLKYQLADLIEPTQNDLEHLWKVFSQDSLILQYLTKVININPLLENIFRHLRKHMLMCGKQRNPCAAADINFMAALAIQAFMNEYVWLEDDEETNLLVPWLQAQSSSAQSAKDGLMLAMYRCLFMLEQKGAYLKPLAQEYSLVADLLAMSVAALQEEANLRDAMLSNAARPMSSVDSLSPQIVTAPDQYLAAAKNVSQQVRDQYEANPYPRWRAPPAPQAQPLASRWQQLPNLDQRFSLSKSSQVLIAGCGTGYEPIDLARTDSHLQITAIDLSAASLAYGQRMALQLGVNNIAFLPCDILDISQLQKTFDVVISTGVLHHMKDPQLGLKTLVEHTRAGGLMRIALYSELAREVIVHARQQIAHQAIASTTESIRLFRQQILAAPETDPLSVLKGSDDFYALSGARDLLFHVQEYRFTLPQIARLLDVLNLQFLTFDTLDSSIIEAFLKRNPQPNALIDLHAWDVFEREHPSLFVGMYHFWVQKRM